MKDRQLFSFCESSPLYRRVSLLWLLFMAVATTALAQTKVITGTVLSEANDPLPGISILVEGKGTGTATNIDGKFSLNAVKGDKLTFSFIGMVSQTVVVGESNVINITMKEDAVMLEEAVVIGYGTAKKRDLTGSIATVKASEIANKPATNPLASIQGKIAGVQIVNTGRAGQDPEIRVRGTNSINGYTPLYVVDGLFTDNINYINPADIETMEVLKDASSLAIFGVRGANGVIIITTKRAKQGQTVVNINTSIGFKHIGDRVELTNAAQFKELYNEQRVNQKADPFDYTKWNADTNWQDEIFQTGFLTNSNISITGSTEKSKFYMGLGYVMEEGSIKSEKLNKLTLSLNSEYSMTDFLRFGFQVNGVRMLPPDSKDVKGALKAAPIATPFNKEEGLYNRMPDFQAAQVGNPMINVDLLARHNLATNYRLAGNVYGELDLLKNLTFKATFSLDYASNQNRQYSPIIRTYDLDAAKVVTTDSESVNQSKSTGMAAQSDYILTWIQSFGAHNLTLMGGLTTNYYEYSSLDGGRSQNSPISNGSSTDKWWISIIPNTSSATNGGSQYQRFTMSYLVRGLYNYNNRYLFNASYRRDGSSVFKLTGNTWNDFYSFGAGWVLSEENFMKSQTVIDYLKLRGSWGVLGSQNTGGYNYPAYPTLVNGGSAVFGPNGGSEIPGIDKEYYTSPDLRWERIYSWEVGFDMHLLQQRLTLSPVYYSKQTKDILAKVPGVNTSIPTFKNVGKVQNKGFEISASWNDKIGKDWRYSLGANLTTIDNKVNSLVSKDYAIVDGVSRTVEGYPIAFFYGYVVEGVYQNNEHIRTSEPNNVAKVRPGDLKFKDVDGDGMITDKDRTMIGNPTPDFTYGMNLSVGYKGFDLSVDMMGVYGNEVYRDWDTSAYAQFNYLTKRMNRWNGEGSSNWEPILDPSRSINLQPSTYFIEDGSFFRIRNIELGYSFNPLLLKKIYLKSLRLYGNIQNLKTWTKNSGYTPEIGGSAIKFGVDDGGYPMPTVYTLGLNLTF